MNIELQLLISNIIEDHGSDIYSRGKYLNYKIDDGFVTRLLSRAFKERLDCLFNRKRIVTTRYEYRVTTYQIEYHQRSWFRHFFSFGLQKIIVIE